MMWCVAVVCGCSLVCGCGVNDCCLCGCGVAEGVVVVCMCL